MRQQERALRSAGGGLGDLPRAGPTSDGQTAQDLYDKRVRWFTPEMKASARELGCRFHQAFMAKDRSAFWAVACWETREGALAFFAKWGIVDEPGEEAILLEGDVGLVTLEEAAER